MDSLPRPVPVKPSAFTNPTVSSSTGSSGLPNQTSSLDSHASASKPTPDLNEDNDNDINSGNGHGVDPNRKRRGNLPKSVTAVLKSWLVQNATHPYPTEEEKTRLSEATQLSMNQISNWFINARRRILQPILVEAAAAAVAGTDAPMDNVLIVRKGKGSRMQVEMECACISDTTGQNQDPGHEHGQSQDQNQTHDHSHPQTD
ncbi:hypothetical protein BGZ76_007570 [Entomortierella beljakovae]|nr:hypothetical protein BGZ76_007570 [Entomortierella beljakovae]